MKKENNMFGKCFFVTENNISNRNGFAVTYTIDLKLNKFYINITVKLWHTQMDNL